MVTSVTCILEEISHFSQMVRRLHQFVFPMWDSPLDIGSGQAISSGDTDGFGLMTKNTEERPVPV